MLIEKHYEEPESCLLNHKPVREVGLVVYVNVGKKIKSYFGCAEI